MTSAQQEKWRRDTWQSDQRHRSQLVKDLPNCFLDVIRDWGCTWLWDSPCITVDENWLEEFIESGTLMSATDGSYIKEVFPDLWSAVFILECTEGRRKIVVSFLEQSSQAGSYCWELLGLPKIHLIILSESKMSPILGVESPFSQIASGRWQKLLYYPRIPFPQDAVTRTSSRTL